ncbi:MAG: O-methyltransferase [Anaerolineae bacterium]
MEQELFDVLSELEMRAETERMRGISGLSAMDALDPDAAKFVSLVAVSKHAKTIYEVGTGSGYSTLWLAYAALATGGKVISCEIDPAKAAEAQANVDKAGMAAYVEILTGDARELLRHRDEPVDLLFIDADYGQYETYFDVVYKQMGVGSTIIADDVVEAENDLADYTTYVQNHPNLESVTLPLGHGLEFSVKTAN